MYDSVDDNLVSWSTNAGPQISSYIFKLVKQVFHFTRIQLLFVGTFEESFCNKYPKLLQVYVRCLLSLNVYANYSTDAVKHVLLLVDAILKLF